MNYDYILHEDAQLDYEEALQWYAERSARAAENFATAINYALRLICEHPTRWRNEYRTFYELGVKKYPYTIVYTIEEAPQLIAISSIYHHKRSLKKKYRKEK